MNFPVRLDINRYERLKRQILEMGDVVPGDPAGQFLRTCGKKAPGRLHLGRRMAQNAPMKYAIYMVGTLALLVIGSITWSTMLLGSH
jgi:hypothetical protein